MRCCLWARCPDFCHRGQVLGVVAIKQLTGLYNEAKDTYNGAVEKNAARDSSQLRDQQ